MKQQSLNKMIANYYDETWVHYRTAWLNEDNLAIHAGYADETTRTHSDELKNMNRILAGRARIMPSERVLDAGCGVGGSSLWLATERGANVVGITVSAKQVAMARHYAARRGLSEHVHFQQADFTATPFPDESFDVVWALESVCYALRKVDFYREAARLLRPGGRVVVADGARASRPLNPGGVHFEQADFYREAVRLLRAGGWVGVEDTARAARPLSPRRERQLHKWCLGWALPDLDTTTEHLEHAASAGFVDAKLEDASEQVRSSSRRLHWVSMLGYPVALAGRLTGTQSAVQYNNVVTSIRQYRGLKRGWGKYFVLTATKPTHVP